MEELLKNLASKDKDTRLLAVLDLLYEDNSDCVPVLKELLLTEKNLHVISAAVKTIGLLAADDEMELIGSYLCHKDSRVRANAVEALGGCSSDAAMNLAAAMVSDENHRVSLNAALLLGDESSDIIDSVLQDLWQSGNEVAQSGVVWAACNLSQEQMEKWVALGIKHKSEVVRSMARLVSDDDFDDSTLDNESADDNELASQSGKKRLRAPKARKLKKKKRKLYVRLAGRVVSGVRKEAVKHVTIRLANSGILELSDRNGRFCFERLEGNRVHVFVCEKLGWPTTTFRLRCTSQREQRTIIRMRSRGVMADR